MMHSWMHFAGVFALLVSLLGASGLSYRGIPDRRSSASTSLSISSNNKDTAISVATDAPVDALALLSEAKALRAQASELQRQLVRDKEERIRKEQAKVDSLIDALLFHGLNNVTGNDNSETQRNRKQQLLRTEEQGNQLIE